MTVSATTTLEEAPLSGPAAAAIEQIEQATAALVELSHNLHKNPEIAFKEHQAAATVADMLRNAGFDASIGAYGLETAVEATYGTGELRVVVCAEYDALPEIGHACGHNIIATAGVGAAIGLAKVADALGLTVVLLGTPAEENGGGKVLQLEAGAWDEAALSVMVHPAPGKDIYCHEATSQAVDRLRVTYRGRAAHAAAAPHAGVNAADAATIALVGIGLLRQQLEEQVRVAAIITQGGDVTNIIPDHTTIEAEVRAFDLETLEDAKKRMLACFEAGATASGCAWEYESTQPRYENLVQHPDLARFWNANLQRLGRELKSMPGRGGGSTDMGNVSQYLPSIHPGIAILGAVNPPHTIGFAAEAASTAGDNAAIDAAKALALTVIDVASDPVIRAELLAQKASRPPYRAHK